MSGQEVAQRDPMSEVIAGIRSDTFKQQVAVALPTNVTPERFVRIAVTAVQQNPEIITADRNSIIRSLIRCAQDGLMPDGREAALVKFGAEAVYMPMIGGFRKIAAEFGWAIDTQVVYANDEFEWELGAKPRLHHKPVGLAGEPGDPIGAYAVATHADGRKLVEVMRKSEIEKVRNVSKAKASGPWRDWTERMWEKTVGRRIFGKLPLGERASEVAARVIEASDAEYELGSGEPSMTVEQANVSAQIQTKVPESQPLDDEPEHVEGEVVPEEEARTFADMIPPGARGES